MKSSMTVSASGGSIWRDFGIAFIGVSPGRRKEAAIWFNPRLPLRSLAPPASAS